MCLDNDIMKESEFIEARKNLEALQKEYEELTDRVVVKKLSDYMSLLEAKVCLINKYHTVN